MTENHLPAGWYPDGHGVQRWWDGHAWTEHTAGGGPGPRGHFDEPQVHPAPMVVAESKTRKSWDRSWQFWVAVACAIVFGIAAVGNSTTPDASASDQPTAGAQPTQPSETPTPTSEPSEPAVVTLSVTDQKDGDSWIGSDGKEYRLGLINAPEMNETCGAEAASFTRAFLRRGFTVDAYTTDSHGRSVAEVFNQDGASLNVAIAKSGLGDDRYLEQFRHENIDLGRRLEEALSTAADPTCRKPEAPVPLVSKPRKTTSPASTCMIGYSPCLPIVADLDCGEIGHRVTVTGSDPYGLDRDGDGVGCD